MATIYDVAREAGVSYSTVSRVVNNKSVVKEVTRQAVLTAIEKLNYVPNVTATSLANRKSKSIGLLIPSLKVPFFAQMAHSLENTLDKAGLNMILTLGHRNAKQEKKGIEFLKGHLCDVFVILVEAIPDEDVVEIFGDFPKLVVIGRKIEGLDHSYTIFDDEKAGYMSTQHLLSLGHTRIAKITGLRDIGHMAKYSNKRLLGYHKALADNNIPFDPQLIIEESFSEEGGFNGTEKLINQKIPFTAILAGTDQMAIGILSALDKYHINVPGKVSVVGFDDSVFSRYLKPPLTTVSHSSRLLGQLVGDLCIHKYNESQNNSLVKTLEPELIIRTSTASIRK